MSYQQYLSCISALNDQFRYYKTLESLFEQDQWAALPQEGGAYRQQVAAHIAQQKAGLFFGEDARAAAEYFAGADLGSMEDEVERGLIRTFLFRYRNARRTPAKLTRQYSMLRADAMNAWRLAREKEDFQIFRPRLEQVFSLKKQIALAIDPDAPAFDTLVGLTDEGTGCTESSQEFEILSQGLNRLLRRIQNSPVRPDLALLSQEEDPARMESFARRLARESGLSADRSSFDNRVVHGFTSFMGPRDARISTPRNRTLSLVFTYLHEAGHAMYASGGNDRVNAANMWGGIEGGFHEAMARFNENMVGRSRAYWEHYYPQLQQEFPSFRGISLDRFYLAMNAVRPSLKRIAADEVTYSLHVILRYELERDYFSGQLAVDEMEERWNELSEKYLGLRPANATQGILQDMHWAGDYIGYFQSYALGNLYGGQLLEAVHRELPDLDTQLAQGCFDKLNVWLDKNVRQYGCCFTAGQLSEKISGKRLDARPFLRYLEEKYTALYQL